MNGETAPPAGNPLVTIFVAAYNQQDYIAEAIQGAFAQTYSPLEVILSDDGSHDDTFEIMKAMAADYRGPHTVIVNRTPRKPRHACASLRHRAAVLRRLDHRERRRRRVTPRSGGAHPARMATQRRSLPVLQLERHRQPGQITRTALAGGQSPFRPHEDVGGVFPQSPPGRHLRRDGELFARDIRQDRPAGRTTSLRKIISSPWPSPILAGGFIISKSSSSRIGAARTRSRTSAATSTSVITSRRRSD